MVFLGVVPNRKYYRGEGSRSLPCVCLKLNRQAVDMQLCGFEGVFPLWLDALLFSCPAAMLIQAWENMTGSKSEG